MGRIHVDILPFQEDGTYEASWTRISDIPDDVLDLGALSQQLDNSEFDVGVYRNSNVKLTVRNDHGRFSEVGQIGTLFKYRRSRSKVKVTWRPGSRPLICGFFKAGHPSSILSEEVTVFEGLLNDLASASDIDQQDIDFQVMGYEALVNEMEVPYASISNGDLFSEVLYTLLNQSPLSDLITVSQANITAGSDQTIDDKAKLEKKTVLEALRMILPVANAVLYVENNVVYVSPRTAEADLAYTFYGSGSANGAENILKIDPYRTGEHRILNYLTWKDATLLAQDATSVAKYGVQKKELSSDLITDTTKRTNILTAVKDEFSQPKREMSLETWFTPDVLALGLLDRVAVDFPVQTVPRENDPTAYYGVGEYSTHYYPDELRALGIEATARFKIMSRKVDFKKETVTFGLREI